MVFTVLFFLFNYSFVYGCIWCLLFFLRMVMLLGPMLAQGSFIGYEEVSQKLFILRGGRVARRTQPFY